MMGVIAYLRWERGSTNCSVQDTATLGVRAYNRTLKFEGMAC